MTQGLTRYADLYSSLEILDVFDAADCGAFLLSGEDADGLAVVARLAAARLCGIPVSRAFDEFADISVYPKRETEELEVKPKASSKKAKKADIARVSPVSADDVREIIDSLYLTPFELDKRVYIIENAESMSDICQNKLLKSLEEPPAHVVFILCTCGALLPTVESRCNRVELAPFPVETVEKRLSEYHSDAKAIALAARAGRGNIGLSERILADEEFASTYETALKILRTAVNSRAFGRTAAIYDKFTRERVASVLGMLEYLLGDIARLLSGAETVFDASDINSASIGFTPKSAAMSAEFVRDAMKRVRANCMPQAVMDVLILKIMEEKALCLK